MLIMNRKLIEINTDPQRRCYNGCHKESAIVWTEWELLEYTTKEKATNRVKFWQELNDYAVSKRGEIGTRCEFCLKEGPEL